MLTSTIDKEEIWVNVVYNTYKQGLNIILEGFKDTWNRIFKRIFQSNYLVICQTSQNEILHDVSNYHF